MKIGYTVFYIFESARLQSKALYRRRDCTGGGLFGRTGGRRTAYFKKDPRITYSQKGATASARTIWAAKLRLAEAAELPSEVSCARCGKQSLPPRVIPLELENLMTEMRMFWIIDKDNRYKTKHRLMEES